MSKIQQLIFYLCNLTIEDRLFTRLFHSVSMIFAWVLLESVSYPHQSKNLFDENIYAGQEVVPHSAKAVDDQISNRKKNTFSVNILSIDGLRVDQKIKSKENSTKPSGATDLSEDLSEYLVMVKKKIEENRYYPPADQSAGHTALITLRLILDATGKTLVKQIINSSIYPSLNQATLESIARAEPFPPFPREISEKQLTIEFGLDYCLECN